MIRSLIRHAMLVMLMLGMGVSALHAAEPVVCVDAPAAFEQGHADGDGDEVPADAGKGYPHHHAGCSGHHLADEVSGSVFLPASPSRSIAVGTRLESLPSRSSDPALRPPIA